MKVKLGENLGNRAIELFRESGHDVSTVFGQNLGGTGEEGLIETCRIEERVLITLDLNFSNVLRLTGPLSPLSFTGAPVFLSVYTDFDKFCQANGFDSEGSL